MLRILKPSLADLSSWFSKPEICPSNFSLSSIWELYIDKVISTLGTLSSVVQNVDSKVQNIESKMHVVDSHSQSIAKLETQLGQLAIAVGQREEGKLPSHSIQNPKGQQFEQLKVIMVLRSGKEVNNKVGEKEHDKEERPKTIDCDLEI